MNNLTVINGFFIDKKLLIMKKLKLFLQKNSSRQLHKSCSLLLACIL